MDRGNLHRNGLAWGNVLDHPMTPLYTRAGHPCKSNTARAVYPGLSSLPTSGGSASAPTGSFPKHGLTCMEQWQADEIEKASRETGGNENG